MKKVLVIREGALGDLILTLPVVQSFKNNSFNVFLAGKGAYKEFFEKYSLIDNFLSIDSSFFLPLFTDEKDSNLLTFLSSFDLVIFYGKENEQVAKNLKAFLKDRVIFHPVRKEGLKQHVIDYLLEPAKKILGKVDNTPVLKIEKLEEIFTVIHPGSGSKNKNYKKEKFFALLKYFRNEKVRVILGPAEFDQYEWWKEKIGEEKILITDNLQEIVNLVRLTRIYIGNDSGISHIFASSGTKTIVIFGPTSPFIWAPRGQNVKIVFKNSGCNPCSQEKMNLCKVKECFDRVEVKDIIKKIKEFEL